MRGRLLYNPETPDEVFSAAFSQRYGDQGANLLEALSLASSTQLRLASLYDSKWDFTLYSEGFLALIDNVTRYITIDDLNVNEGDGTANVTVNLSTIACVPVTVNYQTNDITALVRRTLSTKVFLNQSIGSSREPIHQTGGDILRRRG